MSFKKIAGERQALEIAQQAMNKVAKGAKTAANELLQAAAAADGNQYLNLAEAQAVADAFDAAAAQAGHALTGAEVAAVAQGLTAKLQADLKAQNLDGVTSYFNADGTDLEAKILSGLTETVAAAKGRPTDIDIMIFQFQSRPIADKLLQLARENPNLHIRIIADFSQTAQTPQNQLPYLAAQVTPKRGYPGLENFEIRYKKDAPYTWDAKSGRPAYNHGATKGLNHHKGFVATIDGRPHKVMLGSFNWSKTANTGNYEDLLEIDASKSSSAQRLGRSYLEEFTAFFNHPDALTPEQAKVFKSNTWNELVAKGKQRAFKPKSMPSGGPEYVPGQTRGGFDVNSLGAADFSGVESLVGTAIAKKMQKELLANGRFASVAELQVRVPDLASFSGEALERLGQLSFGSGKVSVNVAEVEELDRMGFTLEQARAIVAERKRNGEYLNTDEVALRVPSVSADRLRSLADLLEDDDIDAFFTSKGFDDAKGSTGYAAAHANATLAVANADGKGATEGKATVSNAIVDMFRRAKPGETIFLSMYGISVGTPEFQELLAAAARGCPVKVILNEGNKPAEAALREATKKFPNIETRVQTAKTLHTKFGVIADDVFTGSSNFSTSASEKNSEDRFVLRNQMEIADAYRRQFDLIWAKSKALV